MVDNEIRTLADVCVAIIDCEHKTAPIDPDGDFFAVGTPAMRGNTVSYQESRRISKETFDLWTRRLAPRYGDLLFAREAPVGPIVRIPKSENVAPGQRTVLVRPDPRQVDTQFLYYLIGSPREQKRLVALAEGSTVAHLNVADVRAFELPALPSVVEQRAIAAVLSAFDDKIGANAKLATTASDLAHAIYRAEVDQLPVLPMSSLLTPILGGTPARSKDDYWGGENLWISAKDVTGAERGVVLDTAEKITGIAVTETKAKPLPAGSVILTARGTVGAVARLGRPSSFNQSCYGFVPDKLPAGVLYFAVLDAADRAKSLAHGSVFDTITMKTFESLVVPDFSNEMDGIERRIAPLLNTVTAMESEARRLVAIRDALLPALMSGRLAARDAEWALEETVSVVAEQGVGVDGRLW